MTVQSILPYGKIYSFQTKYFTYIMSHSRKSVNINKDIRLLQTDLKENFTRGELVTLAKHYGISTLLNKERLTMEIAKANLKSSKRQKARMWPVSSPEPTPTERKVAGIALTPGGRFKNIPRTQPRVGTDIPSGIGTFTAPPSGEEESGKYQLASIFGTPPSGASGTTFGIELATLGPEHLNRNLLASDRTNCMQRFSQLERRVFESIQSIHTKLTELFDALERGLEAEAMAFREILPKVISTCHNELQEIEDCITKALAKTEKAAIQTLQDIEEFLARLAERKSSPEIIAASSLLPPSIEEVVVEERPTEEERVTPSPEEPAVPPASAPEKRTEEGVYLIPTGRSPGVGEEAISPEEVVLGPFRLTEEAKCESDKDCERKKDSGELSNLHPKQKVICVTKRDGSPDCVYQA